MRKYGKRLFCLLLALLMCLSLFPAAALAEGEETGNAVAEEPVEQQEGTDVPTGEPEEEPQAEPAPADETDAVPTPDAEPQSGETHALSGRVLTFDADGSIDNDHVGGTIQVSTASARAGETVSCTVTANPGYRLVLVHFAAYEDEPVADVTASFQAEMWDMDMEFRAWFVPEGGTVECRDVALSLSGPGTRFYTAAPVSAHLTGYFSFTTMAVTPSAFSVTDAVWRDSSGECPARFVESENRQYYADFTLTPHAGWRFSADTQVELTLPDGRLVNSNDDDVTVSYQADGTLRVHSPLISLPSTVTPSDGAVPVNLSVSTQNADGTVNSDVVGGTASFSPANPKQGDQVVVTATPAPGYQLQYVYYDDGVRGGYDATQTMRFTIPDDYYGVELSVCFTPIGTSFPIPASSRLIELPVPGGSYSGPVAGRILNADGEWFDVESVNWYGGEGSGCQGQPPASFQVGAKYYVELVLTPHENFYWKEGTSPLLLYHDPTDSEPFSFAFSGGCASTMVDSQGRLHVVGEEIELPAVTYSTVHLGIEMFEKGGDYPQGCPVNITLPENAGFTVSSSLWYNYANQESGGIGLAAGYFTRDGQYFTEFDLIPNEGCSFTSTTEIVLSCGSVQSKTLRSDGSLHVVTKAYSLDETAAAQYRRVFVTASILTADGSYDYSVSGGRVIVSDFRPRVGDTISIDIVPKSGYRLQWLTVARHSEWIGDDLTETQLYTVTDEDGDVYINVCFARTDEEVPIYSAPLNVRLPAPRGSYSGSVPADVTPNCAVTSQFTVSSARWYLLTDGQASDPTSFVAGNTYAVSIVLTPNEGWSFQENATSALNFSNGEGQSLPTDGGNVTRLSDGTLIVVSAPITFQEPEIEEVELALNLPWLDSTYDWDTDNSATVFTPHVGPMYTLWLNGGYQETGAAGAITTTFLPGGQYYATIRIHAYEGYTLSANTKVKLLNGIPIYTEYSEPDHSIFIHTANITIPDARTYDISGDYLRFYVNGEQVTAARPGDYVEVRDDITTVPGGKYVAGVLLNGTELTQVDLNQWGFTMPAASVSLTAVLEDSETYVFDLEDGVHDVDPLHAAWIFGSLGAGYWMEWDVNGDGTDDIRITFRDDGSVQVVRLGSITGDVDTGILPGRVGKYIFHFGPERYDLYLGGVQVTVENKDNIPVQGGTATYDPDTHTLTLTDVTGVNGLLTDGNSMVGSYFILASGDLNIQGNADLSSDVHGGILCGGNLAMNGDFRFRSEYGVTAQGNLTAGGSLLVTTGDQNCMNVSGNLYLLNCNAYFESEYGDAIFCTGDIGIIGQMDANAAERAICCGGTISFYAGYLHAWSQNDIAIQTGTLSVLGGFLAASGNIQAIEADAISISSSHTITSPENGTIGDDNGKKTVIDPSTNGPAGLVYINGASVYISVGVKDLDGNEGVGGTVDFGAGDYQTSQSGTYPLNQNVTIRAKPASGYAFDHWENLYGENWGTAISWVFNANHSVNQAFYAVFEKLLPIDETTFPDANFRSYVSDNIDTDGDGYLSMAERSAVTSIDVSSRSIATLEGIRYFPELTTLRCSNCGLQGTLDLHWNTKLTDVRCPSNYRITALDVTGCPDLKILYVYSCTSLNSLNLTKNTKLEQLLCYQCALRSLNLSNCRYLKNLLCYNNSNLSVLRVNSDALYRIFCYGTQIEMLDISTCELMARTYNTGTYSEASSYDDYILKSGSTTVGEIRCNKGATVDDSLGIPVNALNFPDPVFRGYVSDYFDLNRNGWLSPAEIAEADRLSMEEDFDLSNVQGIGFMTELTYILIDSNTHLTELDVSRNNKLNGLELWSNGLTRLTLGEQPELLWIDVDDNALTTLDLSGAPNLRDLYVSKNPLTGIDLSVAPNLRFLSIYGTDLQELDLSRNPILLDAYLNGTATPHDDLGYVEYVGGPLGGRLLIDPDQAVKTSFSVTVTTTSAMNSLDGASVAFVSGGGVYEIGQTATLTASNVAGFTFLGWYRDGEFYSDAMTCIYEVTNDSPTETRFVALYEPVSGGSFQVQITAPKFSVTGSDAVQRSYYRGVFNAGEEVTVTFQGGDNVTLLYWINADGKIVSTAQSITFTVVGHTQITAIYSENNSGNNEAMVVFLNSRSNGQVLASRYYSVSDPIEFPQAPTSLGRIFVGWSMTEEQIHAAMATKDRITVYPVFEASSTTYTVTVKNNVGAADVVSRPLSLGSEYTVTADESLGTFSYWTLNGKILGYTPTITVRGMYNLTLTAVYNETVDPVPVITMTDCFGQMNGEKYAMSFVATRSVPDDWTVGKQGILYTTRTDLDGQDLQEVMVLNGSGVRNYESSVTDNNGVCVFTANAKNAATVHARGYMTLTRDGVSVTFYSDEILVLSYTP